MTQSKRKLPAQFYLLSGGFFQTLFFFSLLLFSSLLFSPSSFAKEINIHADAIVFSQLSPLQVQQLQEKSTLELSSVVTVFITATNSDSLSSSTPVFGTATFQNKELVFKPRFNFDTNQSYEYHFSLGDEFIKNRFMLESKIATPTAKVTQVYPSTNVLPENLFKFYIQFNQAMSQGNVYRHISLVDENNVAVELPFLELSTELWNPNGTRLTLLFDPGRTKQGIKPNRDMGLPLQKGKQFTLQISKKWRDAKGQPMLEDFRKVFLVGDQDIQQPNINNWKIATPTIGSKNPVVVTFDEILDFALIQDSISIQNQHGDTISGNISISDYETQWQFTPDKNWVSGNYSLSAKSYLEDVSANSLGRAFEIIRTDDEPIIPDSFSIRFTLSSNKTSE